VVLLKDMLTIFSSLGMMEAQGLLDGQELKMLDFLGSLDWLRHIRL
jgi:hypothetical protein